jgi:phosphopantothenoylcysteine synthetase/decarboxylase
MHVFITAGNTAVPIDCVRCITNIFTGRTGAAIAQAARARGHRVTLATSHPETAVAPGPETPDWSVFKYRTFEDLRATMETILRDRSQDVLVHCAAVSDYLTAGVYATDDGTSFRPEDGRWCGDHPGLVDRAAGKVKSDEQELWLRLVRAPKLIDLVRSQWGFRGTLVKFKLEVGISDEKLLEIAERSRIHSGADLMVANTLEGSSTYAFLGPKAGAYERVSRRDLAVRLVADLEAMRKGRGDG